MIEKQNCEVAQKAFVPPKKPSPLRGKVAPQATNEGGWTALTFHLSHRNSNAISGFLGATTVAFPRVGKVAPQATDEGEIGERTRVTHPQTAFP